MPASVLRLTCFLAALAVATFAYSGHLAALPTAQWVGGIAAAWVLLGASLHEPGEASEGNTRRWLRHAAGVLGAAAAGLFYHLAPQVGSELPAGVAAASAIVLFLLARWVPFSEGDVRGLLGDTGARRAAISIPWLRFAVGLLAIAAGAAVMPLNQSSHLGAFGLWLASLAILVAATWESAPEAQDHDEWTHHGGEPLSRRSEWMALLVILAIATALRLIFLGDYPSLIDPDEGRQGGFAHSLWRDGFPDAFGVGWNTFPHLSYLVEEMWVRPFGKSLTNLRLSSATIGVISILPVYFWARRWWGNVVATLAAFLLAVNHEAIMWSRTGLNNVHQILVAGCMLAAYARALQRNRPLDWVWLGFAAGLAFHTYHACKLYPVLLAVISLVLLIGIPRLARRSLAGAFVGAMAFLLMTGPQLVTSYQQWERVERESSSRFDVHILRDAYERSDTAAVRNYLHTHVGGCLRILASHWPMSIVDPVAAVPFLLGIGWMFWRWRDPRHLTCLVFLFGILCIGGMVTIYPPWKPRLVGMLPILCTIPAVVVGRLRPLTRAVFGSSADFLLAPLLVVFLSASTFVNWKSQFVDWPELHKGRLMTAVCKAIVGMDTPGVVYMAGGMAHPPRVALTECFADRPENVRVVDLANDADIVPLPPNHEHSAMLLVARSHESLLPLIESHYPNATREVIRDNHGHSLHIFHIKSREVAEHRGLIGIFRDDAGKLTMSDRTAPPFTTPARDRALVEATWRGAIWIDEPGRYQIRMQGAALRIDLRNLKAEQKVFLAQGWHEIAVELPVATLAPNSRLEMRRPDGEWQPVDKPLLYSGDLGGGLLRRDFAASIELEGPQPVPQSARYTRIQRAVDTESHAMWSDDPVQPVADRPASTEWVGSVEIPSEMPVEIRLIASSASRLYLNGEMVLRVDPGQHEARTVWTQVGRFPLLLRTVSTREAGRARYRQTRLLWRRAGGPWTSAPSYHLPSDLPQLSQTTM